MDSDPPYRTPFEAFIKLKKKFRGVGPTWKMACGVLTDFELLIQCLEMKLENASCYSQGVTVNGSSIDNRCAKSKVHTFAPDAKNIRWRRFQNLVLNTSWLQPLLNGEMKPANNSDGVVKDNECIVPVEEARMISQESALYLASAIFRVASLCSGGRAYLGHKDVTNVKYVGLLQSRSDWDGLVESVDSNLRECLNQHIVSYNNLRQIDLRPKSQ